MAARTFDVVVIGAVVAEVPMPVLLEAVAPCPTRSEIWLNMLERYEAERGAAALAPAA